MVTESEVKCRQVAEPGSVVFASGLKPPPSFSVLALRQGIVFSPLCQIRDPCHSPSGLWMHPDALLMLSAPP